MIGLPDDVQGDGSEPVDGAMPIATSPGMITALQAALRGTKVWATAWSPPPIWKTTNNKNGSGDGLHIEQARPRALSGLRELPGGLRRPDGQGQRPDHRRFAGERARLHRQLGRRPVDARGAHDVHQPEHGPHLRPALSVGEACRARYGQLAERRQYLTPMLADPAAKDYALRRGDPPVPER